MKQNISKIRNSIKIYPLFYAFSADLILFVPINTLYFTLVKELNASQISAITMIGSLICIISQKITLSLIKRIGNANSIKLGSIMLFISLIVLTFGKSFLAMMIYKTIFELSFMFLNMSSILLRNNLIYTNKEDKYYDLRNKAKIMYGILTMITALISGYLFNINHYIPMYISILIYFIVFLASFTFCEAKIENSRTKSKANENDNNKYIKITSMAILIILSSTVFNSIIQLGQDNSKLFIQYDLQKLLSAEMVTYYVTIIVFISRISRILGNMFFGKLYLKIKDKMSNILTVLACISFLLLIIGHFIEFNFMIKVITMSLGFFIILAIRDSFQVYIEDTALRITKEEEQQKILIDIEVYRKLGKLILSIVFTLILLKFELIVVQIVLLILSIFEIVINKKMCNKLKNIEKSN